MQIVQLKLESEDHATFFKQFKKAKMTWIVLSLLTMVAMGLEIAWNMQIEHNNHDTNKMPEHLLYISLSCLSIQMIVYSILIY